MVTVGLGVVRVRQGTPAIARGLPAGVAPPEERGGTEVLALLNANGTVTNDGAQLSAGRGPWRHPPTRATIRGQKVFVVGVGAPGEVGQKATEDAGRGYDLWIRGKGEAAIAAHNYWAGDRGIQSRPRRHVETSVVA